MAFLIPWVTEGLLLTPSLLLNCLPIESCKVMKMGKLSVVQTRVVERQLGNNCRHPLEAITGSYVAAGLVLTYKTLRLEHSRGGEARGGSGRRGHRRASGWWWWWWASRQPTATSRL